MHAGIEVGYYFFFWELQKNHPIIWYTATEHVSFGWTINLSKKASHGCIPIACEISAHEIPIATMLYFQYIPKVV